MQVMRTEKHMRLHTSVGVDAKLISNVDVAFTRHASVRYHFWNQSRISLPLAAAKRASHVSCLGLGPHLKAVLMDVLSTRRLTPDD